MHTLAFLVPMFAAQLACDARTCASRPEAERLACVVDACDPGESGDLCRVEHVGEIARTEDVLALAGAIHDPVLRDTAVIRWSRDREAGMRRADALTLCDVLTDQEKGACRRRLSTPHLQR
jgi:hypothetical protein